MARTGGPRGAEKVSQGSLGSPGPLVPPGSLCPGQGVLYGEVCCSYFGLFRAVLADFLGHQAPQEKSYRGEILSAPTVLPWEEAGVDMGSPDGNSRLLQCTTARTEGPRGHQAREAQGALIRYIFPVSPGCLLGPPVLVVVCCISLLFLENREGARQLFSRIDMDRYESF